ncbi:flagellar basal body rod protein FlgC [Zobellella denitrificans]|uniref:Flagellar basal-body rod protein FlgC n=1 Tax=Zobellella denitrificans TaxID=347534 RepID=A0A231MW24_9GAMM|nr:flagellar basal body rod protein FlgC [Zobellella denitrificans]ATG73177.1 flagellar biosynthesis protein FlgC [Zobellella denitrificans]OXS14394.1 flagellar basal body rod protein FlgC [Zobellella denitrificans]
MSLFKVFDISGSAMSAQSVRLNTTASNLANADSVSSSINETYRARKPVFAADLDRALSDRQESVGVKVLGVVETNKPLQKEFRPDHPMADQDGFIYKPNVNVVEEMTDMLSASRNYQTNVQVADAAKQMLQQTLRMGKG